MSSIVTALTGGGGGGSAGMGYRPAAAPVVSPVTAEQATEQYGNVNQGLLGQQNFVDAVRAQHGLQNQSNVFNQLQGVANGTGPNPAQQQLANATGANIANQAALMAGQRGAGANTGLIARQAAMQGANTQQNAAGQAAALQAQQSLNALNQMGGLATNQANQQANATNAYTNAALQAQQNALNSIAGSNTANVGMQSNINNVNGALAGNVATQQGNMMGNLMGGIGSAGNLFKGAGGLFGGGSSGDITGGATGNTAGIIGGSGMLMDGGTAASGADAANAGGLMGGSGLLMAEGGMVKKYADGGEIANDTTILLPPPETSSRMDSQSADGPQSNIAKMFAEQQAQLNPTPVVPIKGVGGQQSQQSPDMSKVGTQALGGIQGALSGGGTGSKFGPIGGIIGAGIGAEEGSKPMAEGHGYGGSDFNWGQAGEGAAKGAASGAAIGSIVPGIGTAIGAGIGGVAGGLLGGFRHAEGGMVKVPALVSPGEKYLSPKDVKKVEKGADPLEEGKTIPGKPKVAGAKNSYANDTVPATLDEGGIVLPRSVTMAKDAPEKAKAFVHAIMKKNKQGK